MRAVKISGRTTIHKVNARPLGRSNLSFSRVRDCFASLAMTKIRLFRERLPGKVFFVAILFFYAGCSGPPSESGQLNLPFMQSDAALYARYGPARIDILPITTINPTTSSAGDYTIDIYVCLLDSFDSQIKAPATFRFELFQQVQRSNEPKGKRILIWPDINLTDSVMNNNHWQDFLRAYLFSLPLERSASETAILQVTCISPSGKRLTADFPIRLGK
jgi:hypothetical protein